MSDKEGVNGLDVDLCSRTSVQIKTHGVHFVLPALVADVSLCPDRVDSDLCSFCRCVSGVRRGDNGHVVGDQNQPSEHGAILSRLSYQ